MKLKEAKQLVEKLAELWPDDEVRLTIESDDMDKLDAIRDMGFFAHLEASAYADAELVVKDRYDGYARPTRDETPPSGG